MTIPLDGNGTDAVSTAALETLRNDILPATIGTAAGRDVRGQRRHRRVGRLRTRC